jgi:hypothetical protein
MPVKPAFGDEPPPLRDAVKLSGGMRRSVRRILAAARPAVLADLADDPAYLAIKEELGEVLTASERARLEAARAGSSGPKPAGGGA